MAFETKVILISIFEHVNGMDLDETAKRKVLDYVKRLANAEGVIVDQPEVKKGDGGGE